MRCATVALLMLLAGSDLARAEIATADLQKQVERLVAELDDNDFLVRERATEELISLGKPILPLLQAARGKQPNFEVAARLDRILSIHAQQVRKDRFEEIVGRILGNEPAQLAKIEEELVGLGSAALTAVKEMVAEKKLEAEAARRVNEMFARAEKRIHIKQVEAAVLEKANRRLRGFP